MKWLYFVASVAACLIGAVYIAAGEWLLGALWLTSGVTDAIIAVTRN